MSEFRHELKHELGTSELLALRQRLRAVLDPDKHSPDGRYSVRSLYFDDARDTALREKQDGVGSRQKFRLRLYNGDPGFVKLEKKIKRNGLCCKLTEPMRADTVRAVISGSSWTPEGPLSQELKARMASGLLPKTIVDYTREAYTFPAGNVRVTLDYDIRSGLDCTALFDADCTTVPVPGHPAILEVKWDEFLPDIVRDAVALRGIRTGAFSKYAACRAYG
jgi:hypothetical protein